MILRSCGHREERWNALGQESSTKNRREEEAELGEWGGSQPSVFGGVNQPRSVRAVQGNSG